MWRAEYAVRRSRRCHAGANSLGRSVAVNLLGEGAGRLRGRRCIDCIDNLPEELGPDPLGRRFRQELALGHFGHGRTQPAGFVESRSSPAIPETAQAPIETPHQTSAEQTASETRAFVREMEPKFDELFLREGTEHASVSLDNARQMMRTPQTTSSDNRASIEISSQNQLTEAASQRASTEQPNSGNIRGLSFTHFHPRPGPIQTMPRAPTPIPLEVEIETSRAPVSSTLDTTSVNRRPTEGDCGICLCALQEPQSDDSHHGYYENTDDDRDEEEQDENGNDDHNDDDSDDQKDEDSDTNNSDDDSNEESDSENDSDRKNDDGEEWTDTDENSDDDSDGDGGSDEEDDDNEDIIQWSDTDDINHNGNSDEDNEVGDSGDEDLNITQPEKDGLVWCKARCGVNYHKMCVDQWLATDLYAPCPTCRNTWRR